MRGHLFADPNTILWSGFAGGAATTISLFVYQMRFGTMYQMIGLLMACFMIGAVSGGLAGTAAAHRARRARWALLTSECALVAMPTTLIALARGGTSHLFFVALLIVGAAIGIQFPIVASRSTGNAVGVHAGRLAALDFIGGFLGATLVAVFILPIGGVNTAALAIVLLKLATLVGQGAALLRPDGTYRYSV